MNQMFYSQCQQDIYLEQNIFRGYKNGFFMDIGAHDGVSLNNTLYFEKHNNWTGVNVEPIKNVYDKLVENRPSSINLNCAVSDIDGTAQFYCNTGYTEMLSGLKSNYDERHLGRLTRENRENNSITQIIDVETKRVETICDIHNIKHIHYLSIDVEGAEFNVIKSINFDKVFIDVIEFENNYDDISLPIIHYLESKNFVIIHKSLDIFMINKASQFYAKNITPK
jgi:FkbM family methyltransferase